MNKIFNEDCLSGMACLPEKCVHTCVTSPPYFGLRDYGNPMQIGLETTPQEFIETLVTVFRGVKRVLRDDGTLWLNLGDSHSHGGCGARDVARWPKQSRNDHMPVHAKKNTGCKPGDLIGIPWRVALALQEDGWFLRSDIIWNKPNAMPESVKNRPTMSHEHIFLMSKSKKYYYDSESIKEPAKTWTGRAASFDRSGNAVSSHIIPGQSAAQHRPRTDKQSGHGARHAGFNERYSCSEKSPTRNRRDVWTIATIPLRDAHFATFPTELIRPCILAGAPLEGLVLDPFMGAGTTAMVAKEEGRNYVGFELNPEYIKIAEKRIGGVVSKHLVMEDFF